jgi:hypothetical protein
VPITVEMAAVHIPISTDSDRACMNSRRAKKLANHLRENPWGGNVRKLPALKAARMTMAMGSKRNT